MLRRRDALGRRCAGEKVGLLQQSELWGVLLHFGELLIAIICSLLGFEWKETSIVVRKEVEITKEMERYKIQVLGISEVKKKGSGTMKLENGYVLRY
jgi:hypothetical protein